MPRSAPRASAFGRSPTVRTWPAAFSYLTFNWPGSIVRANGIVAHVLECAGMTSVGGKLHGSRNALNIVRATFAALQKQTDPQEIAQATGRRLVDLNTHRILGRTHPPSAKRRVQIEAN